VETNPTASALIYGQTLASSTLSGGAMTIGGSIDVAGTFSYADPTYMPTRTTAGRTVRVQFFPTNTVYYDSTSFTMQVTVDQKPITIASATVANKRYNGFTDTEVTAATFAGLVNGEVLTLTADFNATALFDSPSIGTNKAVTVTVLLTSTKALNYSLSVPTYATTANIVDMRPTTPELPVAAGITYGEPLSAATLSGGRAVWNGGDVAGDWTYVAPTAVPTVAGNRAQVLFTPTGWSPTSAGADTVHVWVTVPVAAKTITIASVTVSNKEYDGSTDAVVAAVAFGGLLGSETLTPNTDYTVVGRFDTPAPEEGKTVTVTVTLLNSAKASNYTLPQNVTTTTATITGASSVTVRLTLTMEGSSETTDYVLTPGVTRKLDVACGTENLRATATETSSGNPIAIQVNGATLEASGLPLDPKREVLYNVSMRVDDNTYSVLVKVPFDPSIMYRDYYMDTVALNTNYATNAPNNPAGGYSMKEYQWILNGTPQEGTDKSYLVKPEGFSGDLVAVKVTLISDEAITSCPMLVQGAAKASAALEAYPNPVRNGNRLTVTRITPQPSAAKAELLSISGSLLRTFTVPAGADKVELDMAGYSAGAYLLRIGSQTTAIAIE
jgi:hypothetical protein